MAAYDKFFGLNVKGFFLILGIASFCIFRLMNYWGYLSNWAINISLACLIMWALACFFSGIFYD
ncbi:MAG: hypothetical protein NT076_04355 [Candidatus Pacearchaeota archaeon]|nr:hypothetical protein [Candidatus Pacearchaeota archaeon]